jgi:alpha-glucoside transport system substrate-binding protein
MAKSYVQMTSFVMILLLATAGGVFAGGQQQMEEEAEEVDAGSVSVVATWGGNEQDVFNSMIAPYEEETGVQVNYTGTRDMDAVMTTRVQAGNPPDIAAFANPAKLYEFADQGALVDLSGVLDMDRIQDEYSQGWLDRGSVDGSLYGIFTKAAAKGFVWYDPATREQIGFEIPETWNELLSVSRAIVNNEDVSPWAVGIESGAATGWVGTDWLEHIFLKMHGPDLYADWHNGELSWTSDEMRAVWNEWGKIVGNPDMIYGGSQYVISTNFGEAHAPVFREDPAAVFHFQATFLQGFISDQFPDLTEGEDFTVFRFPSIADEYANSIVGSGDVFAMFNETEQSTALIRYLSTATAQEYWIETGAISPNSAVALDAYENPLIREAARAMNESEIVVFDASDLMPSEVNQQFFSAVTDFVSNPDNLDSILEAMEEARQAAY